MRQWFALGVWVVIAATLAADEVADPAFSIRDGNDTFQLAVRVMVNGESASKAWRSFHDQLFAFADLDSSGGLSATEIGRLPELPLRPGKTLKFSLNLVDQDGDGLATPAEIRRVALDGGFAPLLALRNPWENDGDDHRLERILFSAGERDKAPLAPAELRARVKSWSRFDLNDDERIGLAEILGGGKQPSVRVFPETQPASPPKPLITIDVRSGKLRVQFDESKRGVQIAAGYVRGPGDRWILLVDESADVPDVAAACDFTRALLQDGRGPKSLLSRQEWEHNAELRGLAELCAAADRNRDEVLTPAEIDAWLQLVQSAFRAQQAVVLHEQGGNLFGLFDRNGDDQITAAETAAVSDLAADWQGKSLPRVYRLGVAPPPHVSLLGLRLPAAKPRLAKPSTVSEPAPAWHAALDVNRDGFVSAREYPGPPAVFRKMDTSGDGLLSAAESAAVKP